MFYQLIQRKRDEWLSRNDCPVKGILQYITATGKMRDAQIEAIKTYLFLKIACDNKPLWRLFTEGDFLTMDIYNMALTYHARERLLNDKAAATLYEYACLKDDSGKICSPALKAEIEQYPDDIDYEKVFRDIFYGVKYSDYIFSLPMGAGKTFLMAAFIYLDLYFTSEHADPAFAQNFMILVPSGLKSSIMPSIKTIQNFDPTWILPEPTASKIRKEIMFEVLDEQKSGAKSNIVRNPNAQKINIHQPFENLRGLVTVTNAEKVILNKIDKDPNSSLFTEKERSEINNYNELRNIIAKIPHLAIYIDEVHHASDGDIKLRQVVNGWAQGSTFNCVLGFSGTPYLSSADDVQVSSRLSMKNKNLANVVYYYPLIDGVGNFLKAPTIKVSTGDWHDIVRNGVEEFLEKYGDTAYSTSEGNILAKQAIYCPHIEDLEERIYPLVAEIVSQHGMNPSEVILKYHKGNKTYPIPVGAEGEFASLDSVFSKKRIVLLVQIGKEGWDCKSLTSVILPQKGSCPQNMVLQTSCRCLRQVVRYEKETALIWLNDDNGKTLNRELQRQQHTSIKEINEGGNKSIATLHRFSRMQKLEVPPIEFNQFRVTWPAKVIESELDVAANLSSDDILAHAKKPVVEDMDLKGRIINKDLLAIVNGESIMPVTFHAWLHEIISESFGTLTYKDLKPYEETLRGIYDKVTTEHDGEQWLSDAYDHAAIRANIRKAFVPKRTIDVKEEVIPEKATILEEEKLQPVILTEMPEEYYPEERDVMQIVKGGKRLKDSLAKAVEELKTHAGNEAVIKMITDNDANYDSFSGGVYDKTYHYLPYHFDSDYERRYFSDSLLAIIHDRNLEVYYNGDDTLTGFKIRCYQKKGEKDWKYLGLYVPDFLMLSRDENKNIKQVLIIETKGEGFAAKFKERKEFMNSKFTEINKTKFRFLYIEDDWTQEEQDRRTIEAINTFFK